MSIPAFARRRETPSPASITYSAPLTISRLDDCARWALGLGPLDVPSVMRRVPAFDGAALVCAILSCASAMILMLIRIVNSSDRNFCMFPPCARSTSITQCVSGQSKEAKPTCGGPLHALVRSLLGGLRRLEPA